MAWSQGGEVVQSDLGGGATISGVGLLEEPEHSSFNWYVSREEIENCSPSRLDGIDLKEETSLRKSYCEFLRDLGKNCLRLPQMTIATAIVFSHRFFLRQSHLKNDRFIIATICMFLAGKVEETPRSLRDVIFMSNALQHMKNPVAVPRIKEKAIYEQQMKLVLAGERLVLSTLGFDLNIRHPYRPLVSVIKKLRIENNELVQIAWNFVNDELHTSLCLQFKPHHIALGAIFLAARVLKVKLPTADGEKIWCQGFEVTPRQLEEVCNQMLQNYASDVLLPKKIRINTNFEAVNTGRVKALPQKTCTSNGAGFKDENELLERELERGVEAHPETPRGGREFREVRLKPEQKVEHDTVFIKKESVEDGESGWKRRVDVEKEGMEDEESGWKRRVIVEKERMEDEESGWNRKVVVETEGKEDGEFSWKRRVIVEKEQMEDEESGWNRKVVVETEGMEDGEFDWKRRVVVENEGMEVEESGWMRKGNEEDGFNQKWRTRFTENGDRAAWADGEADRSGLTNSREGGDRTSSSSHIRDQTRSPRQSERTPVPSGSGHKNGCPSSSKRHRDANGNWGIQRDRWDVHCDAHRDSSDYAHRDSSDYAHRDSFDYAHRDSGDGHRHSWDGHRRSWDGHRHGWEGHRHGGEGHRHGWEGHRDNWDIHSHRDSWEGHRDSSEDHRDSSEDHRNSWDTPKNGSASSSKRYRGPHGHWDVHRDGRVGHKNVLARSRHKNGSSSSSRRHRDPNSLWDVEWDGHRNTWDGHGDTWDGHGDTWDGHRDTWDVHRDTWDGHMDTWDGHKDTWDCHKDSWDDHRDIHKNGSTSSETHQDPHRHSNVYSRVGSTRRFRHVNNHRH